MTTPDPAQTDSAGDLYDRYVSTHFGFVGSSEAVSHEKRLLLWQSYLLDHVPSDRSAAILEIGCGTGYNLSSLAALGFVNVLGVDVSPECVDACGAQGLKAELVGPDLATLTGSFDLIVLYDVLEHFDASDAVRLLRSVERVLSPAGRLLISVPCCDYPPNLSLRYSDVTHRTLYNAMSLGQLLRMSGFELSVSFGLNALTAHDSRRWVALAKRLFGSTVSRGAELFWRALLLAQGVSVGSCRPTLVAVGVRAQPPREVCVSTH